MFDGETMTADGLPIVAQANGHNALDPPTVMTEAAPAPAITGEVMSVDDDTDDNYRVEVVNMRKMTWGDQMIFTRYQLLIETIGDADNENTTKTEKVAALKELIAGFDELTAFFDRVTKVSKNGARVRMNEVPMDFIEDIMGAISKARTRRGNPNG